jgi:adhesin transport system outer membrane protein
MWVPVLAGWAGLAALGLLIASPASAETLEEAVAQTLATSPDVLIDASRRQSAEETVNQSLGGFLPHADLAYGRGHQRPDNLTIQQTYGRRIGQLRYDRSLTITQMLFDGAATASDVTRNRARTASAAHRVAATSEQTALRATEAYLEVLRNQELLALTQENLTVHQRTFDQIKLRAASGVGRKADLDQIEARLALAQSNVAAAEANLRVAEINYRLIVGTKPGTLAVPKAPDSNLVPKTVEIAIPIAQTNNRLLKSAKADVEAAIAQNHSAKAAMMPRVDLELGISKNELVSPVDNTPDINRSAMVRFRYNLSKGGSDMARIAETGFQIREAEEIARRTERQLEQSIRLSWNAYSSAAERLPFLQKHADASELTRAAYNKQFALGQRTLLDLLDAENEAFTASSNLLNGRYVELYSRYRVLADMGMLLSVLGVAQLNESQVGER